MSGKGDKPRNCFSKSFHKNFEKIKWNKVEEKQPDKTKKGHKIFIYK